MSARHRLAAMRLGAALTLAWLGSNAALAGAAACAPLPLSRVDAPEVRGYVTVPGSYCLGQDIDASARFDIHAGSFKSLAGEALIKLECPQDAPCARLDPARRFELDLQGHTLTASAGEMAGVSNTSGGMHVSVRNGRIVVPGKSPTNIGVVLRAQGTGFKVKGAACWPTDPACADIAASAADGARAPTYEASDYVVDGLTVRAGWRGVQMGGANKVLRNSTIEVDSATAAFLFGPGALIENNTFIVHGKGARSDFDGALKLRDAHGAIVRNNTFIFRGGWFGKAPAAIHLLDSTGVVIEGNTFQGFDQHVATHGASAYR